MREWFAASEIVNLAGMPATDRQVRNRALADNWTSRKRAGRGGGREYHIESLPPETQAALLREHGDIQVAQPEPASSAPFTYDCEDLSRWAESRPQHERDEGARRARVLHDAMRLADNGMPKRKALHHAADVWDLQPGTVRNWYYGNGKPGARHYERRDWAYALMDQHQGRTATADCSHEAWQFYKADYLRPEQPTHAACYRRLRDAAAQHGWTIPSAKTLRRRIEAEVPKSVRVLLREGEHALRRMYPSQKRTVRHLRALEWINGDGYSHNVFVQWPDGTIARPKTWFWQDVYSRRMLAWRTDVSEHSGLIMLAIGDVLDHWGIPEHCTIDNTRAAANKYMTGGVPSRYRFTVRDDDILGLLPSLGVQVHWTGVVAGKGWGQAKPVERSFKTVGGIGDDVDKDPRLAGAYTGPNVEAKPENYQSRAIPLATFEKVLDEAIRRWNAEPGRRSEVCAGELSYDDAFRQSYQRHAHLIPRPTDAQRRQWLMAAEQVRVGRDGTVALQIGKGPEGKNRYASDRLLEHAGQRVVVRFDPDDLHGRVHAYTADNRYIGPAECMHAAGFGDAAAGREWQRQRTRKVRAQKQAAKADERMNTLEIGRLMPQPGDGESAEDEAEMPNVVRAAFGAPMQTTGTEDAGGEDAAAEDFEATFGAVVRQIRSAEE